MSAFLVEDDTINRIVCWLSLEVSRNHQLKQQLETTLGIDTSMANWEAELGQALFQLNIDGVNERYGEGQAATFRQLDYHYRPVAPVSEVQVLKSLQCWLYQCTEGEVTKKLLYRFFDSVVEIHLLRKIVYGLPAYDNAKWG